MTDPEFDELLRAAMKEELDDECARAEEWLKTHGISPSPEYEAAMAEMLADPNGYLRRRERRGRRKKTLHIALVAALAAAAIIIGACALFPALRGWVQEVYETKITYWLTGKEQGKYTAETLPDDIRPAFIPEGYEEIDCVAFNGTVRVIYQNPDGDQLTFIYMVIEEGKWISTSLGNHKEEETELNGMKALIARAEQPEKTSNYIILLNEPTNVAFRVGGKLDIETLTEIVCSIPTEF